MQRTVPEIVENLPYPASHATLAWQDQLRGALREPEDFVKAGLIDLADIEIYRPIFRKYSALVPPYYADLIDRSNPRCPIRLQCVPQKEEAAEEEDLTPDPLADLRHQPAPHITHRYPDRALLHLTSNCSMLCRFCFRKSLLNEGAQELFGGRLEEGMDYLKKHSEISEVILTGGDPLMVSDLGLERILNRLNAIPHLARIRFHTRVPVTLPYRITPALRMILSRFSKKLVMVLHFNHPRELTPLAIETAQELRRVVNLLLNQSVLLKGVNDDAEILRELSLKLSEAGILPYYLHHPDKAAGTKHLQYSPREGLEIWKKLSGTLPGYLIPRYVIDVIGQPQKTDVESYVNATRVAGP